MFLCYSCHPSIPFFFHNVAYIKSSIKISTASKLTKIDGKVFRDGPFNFAGAILVFIYQPVFASEIPLKGH